MGELRIQAASQAAAGPIGGGGRRRTRAARSVECLHHPRGASQLKPSVKGRTGLVVSFSGMCTVFWLEMAIVAFCYLSSSCLIATDLSQVVQQKKHGLKDLFSGRGRPSSKAPRRTPGSEPSGSPSSSSSTSPSPVPLSHSQVKVMNNYVGIGIDAQVAVEFHQIRDSYPALFQSQVRYECQWEMSLKAVRNKNVKK